MRILLFSDIFCEDTTTFIYNEAVGLKRNNHEVLYLCNERRNEKKFPFQNVVTVPFHLNPVIRKIRWYLEVNDIKLSFKNNDFSQQITRVIEDFKPDIIHCHFGYQALKLLDNYNYNNIPVVVTFHGYDATFKFNRRSYIKTLKAHFHNPNLHIILACNFFKENFSKNEFSSKRTSVIYCGIDLSLFNRSNHHVTDKPFVFLQISSFHTKKGHYYTVMAFKKMIDEHPEFKCQLVFGGDGPHYEEIIQLTRQLGLSDRVIFKGLVSPTEAKMLLEEANCFLHHSITSETGDSEACTNSIMEAMAMELPVISTRHGGIPELVTDKIHGFLVEEKDIDTYALKMWEIRDWGFRKENREHIEEKFQIAIHIKNLESEFMDIINRKKRAANALLAVN